MKSLIKIAIDMGRRALFLGIAGKAASVVSRNIDHVVGNTTGAVANSMSMGVASPLSSIARVTRKISDSAVNIAKFRKAMIDRVEKKDTGRGLVSAYIGGKIYDGGKKMRTAKRYLSNIEALGSKTPMRKKLITGYNNEARKNSLPQINAEKVEQLTDGAKTRFQKMRDSYNGK